MLQLEGAAWEEFKAEGKRNRGNWRKITGQKSLGEELETVTNYRVN